MERRELVDDYSRWLHGRTPRVLLARNAARGMLDWAEANGWGFRLPPNVGELWERGRLGVGTSAPIAAREREYADLLRQYLEDRRLAADGGEDANGEEAGDVGGGEGGVEGEGEMDVVDDAPLPQQIASGVQAASAPVPHYEEVRVAPPAPRKRREAKAAPRAAKSVTPVIDAALPSAGQIVVKKAQPNGKPQIIGYFNAPDIAGHGSIQRFIYERIVRAHGGGTYTVNKMGADGSEIVPGWDFDFADVPGVGGSANAGVLAGLPAAATAPVVVDVAEQAGKLLDVVEKFRAAGGRGTEIDSIRDQLRTMSQTGGRPSDLQTLADRLMQQRTVEAMLQQFNGGGHRSDDPRVFALEQAVRDMQRANEELKKLVEQGQSPPPDPVTPLADVLKMAFQGQQRVLERPPPAPPPQFGPSELVGVVAQLADAIRPKGEDATLTVLKEMLAQNREEMRELRTQLAKAVEPRPRDEVTEKILQAGLDRVLNPEKKSEPGSEVTMATLLQDIIRNPAFLDKAISLVSVARGVPVGAPVGAQPRQLVQQPPSAPQQIVQPLPSPVQPKSAAELAFEEFLASGADAEKAARSFAMGIAAVLRDPKYKAVVWPHLDAAYKVEGGLAAFVTAMADRMGAQAVMQNVGVMEAIVAALVREEASLRALAA